MALVGLGGLLAVPAQAKEVDGILRFILTQTRQNDTRADGHTGTLDVRWNRPVTRNLSYLLSARYSTGATETLFGIDPRSTATDELEPRLQVRWTRPHFELSFGDRWRRTATETEDFLRSVRTENNVFARFNTRFDNIPQFLLDFNRRDVSFDDQTPDRINSRLLAQLSYTRPSWMVSLGQRRTLDENRGLRERTVDETLLNASVNRLAFSNRVSFFANYALNDLNTTDELAVDTLVPIERLLRAGLAVRDVTPDQGALLPEPGLIDGNRVAATRVNIGGGLAGGEVDWNFGAELLAEEPVDVIDIWLSAPIPVENARVYSWQVWSSSDNMLWSLVTVTTAFDYDRFDGRFRLRFPAVEDRFIKVVNRTVDDTLGAVFVSEIEMFGRELRSGESRSGTRTQNLSTTFLWNPHNPLAFSLSGFRSDVSSENEGQATNNQDTTGNFTLIFEPSRVFLGSASTLYTRRERTLTEPETEWSYSLTLTALPHEDLELTTVANLRDRQRGNEIAEVQSLLFRISSLLYRDLSLAAEYGRAHEESFDAPTRERETIRAILDARPRDEIELNSMLLMEWIEFPLVIPGEPLRRRNVNWDTRLTVRPSSVLNITIQAIYFELPQDSGWSRIFQIDWLPLPDGAIQFSVDFREEVPLGGLQRRLRSTRLRWNLNRDMFLDFDATRQRIETADGVGTARTLLSAFFQMQF